MKAHLYLFLVLMVALFISCNSASSNDTSRDLSIILNDGTSYSIPESYVNSYYASLSQIIIKNNVRMGSLNFAYDELEMTHNDRVAYATLWLIDNGYEDEVIKELRKVCRKKKQ